MHYLNSLGEISEHKPAWESKALMVDVKHTVHARALTDQASERFPALLLPDFRHELALSGFARDVWTER
jgi:hypothetical protein